MQPSAKGGLAQRLRADNNVRACRPAKAFRLGAAERASAARTRDFRCFPREKCSEEKKGYLRAVGRLAAYRAVVNHLPDI